MLFLPRLRKARAAVLAAAPRDNGLFAHCSSSPNRRAAGGEPSGIAAESLQSRPPADDVSARNALRIEAPS